MQRRPVPGDLLRASAGISAWAAPQPLNGYVCSYLWDCEQERTAQGVKESLWSYSMKIRVPLPPAEHSNQMICLFNSIQPSASKPLAVLQPVLNWGREEKFWSIASWYVRGKPGASDIIAARTKPIRVDAGTDLVATISLIEKYEIEGIDMFSYVCEFSGIAGSYLAIDLSDELVRAYAALECYDVVGDAQLPASPSTSFRDVTIELNAKNRASPNWRLEDKAPESSGITMKPVTHAGITDQFDITYR